MQKKLRCLKKRKEIETLHEKYHIFDLHKQVKEITNRFQKWSISILGGTNIKIIVGKGDIIKWWEEYTEKLVDDDRPLPSPITNYNYKETDPSITKSEIIHALRVQKTDSP